MKPGPKDDLRRKAEDRLNERIGQAGSKEMENGDSLALIHELQVHQIELEMQNEELRQVQAELAVSESKYRDLYEFAPIGYLTLDGSGRILEANLTSESLLGTERKYLVNNRFQAYLDKNYIPEFNAFCSRVLESGEKQVAEFELNYTQRGREAHRWVLIEARAMLGDICQGFQMAVIDITKRKLMEEELMAAKEAAEEAVRAKAAFLANMSHELRTPLNSIIGFTSLLLEEPQSPEYKDWLEIMRTSGEALLALINDVLDFSKLEKEKTELELHPSDLRQSIEESLDLVSTKAAEKGLDLAYTMESNVPETIITDSARLRQVLANLLSNAVKYTDKGDVVVSVSSKPEEVGHGLHFAVQDTGIGMLRNQMSKLFQPFSQISLSCSRLNEGTGLGLAISKKLVELMGGRIWVESEEGKGSIFHFTIKAMADSESGKVPVEHQRKLAKRSVLIVDDNKTIRGILAHQTQSWGMIPIIASSGYEALDRVQKGVIPDVAILDVGMPDMDGIKLAEMIRRNQRNLPIIMLTSLGHHIPPGLSAASLAKPIKPMQLYDTLAGLFDGRPLQTQEHIQVVNHASITPLRILLAEDNVSSQMITQGMLKKLGYRADIVSNGIEVIQALERQPYDVVLMDLKMPEMDGFEATREIRQRWPNGGPRVIAITAYALDGCKEKCLEAGMEGYIGKPVRMDELREALAGISSRLNEDGKRDGTTRDEEEAGRRGDSQI
ncbi:MAG: response regulator [Methanotrichaceae archaeon]